MRRGKVILRWVRYAAVMGILLVSFQNCGSEHMLGSTNGSTGDPGYDPTAFNLAQTKALEVLQLRCASCHDGTVSGTTPDVMDVVGLRSSQYIIPGFPQNSPIYLTIVDGSMPPGGPNLAGTPELTRIRDWIQMMR